MLIETVKTDSLGVNLCQDADGYRPGIGDHQRPPVERQELPLLCRFLGRPARRKWLHTPSGGVREAPRHEIAGCFEVYGDLTGAAMMAAVA